MKQFIEWSKDLDSADAPIIFGMIPAMFFYAAALIIELVRWIF